MLVLWVVLLGLIIFTRNSHPGVTDVRSATRPSPSPTFGKFETFQGNGFRFSYPDNLTYQYQSEDATVWKAAFVNDSFIYNSMVLRRQSSPFNSLTVGSPLQLFTGKTQPSPVEVTIKSVEEEKEITVDGAPGTRYTISCGTDCYYHLVRFELTGYYYEILSDGAGADLLTRFEQVLASIDIEATP